MMPTKNSKVKRFGIIGTQSMAVHNALNVAPEALLLHPEYPEAGWNEVGSSFSFDIS
jgi:hypothetical protein